MQPTMAPELAPEALGRAAGIVTDKEAYQVAVLLSQVSMAARSAGAEAPPSLEEVRDLFAQWDEDEIRRKSIDLSTADRGRLEEILDAIVRDTPPGTPVTRVVARLDEGGWRPVALPKDAARRACVATLTLVVVAPLDAADDLETMSVEDIVREGRDGEFSLTVDRQVRPVRDCAVDALLEAQGSDADFIPDVGTPGPRP